MRFVFVLMLLAGSLRAADQVAIAAAANLAEVFPAIGKAFEAATRIHPTFSFGSTAQLAQQIENGAPFDIFAAADTEHVDQLIAKDLLIKNSRVVYATGVLALWFPQGDFRIADLNTARIRVIAMAKPELAPYGEAALETLRHLGMWQQVQPKVVYASNISMARQYGASGNADAVFTAYSLVLKEHGRVIRIDEAMHQPIRQAAGIVRASRNSSAAQAFMQFLGSSKSRKMLETYGYR